MQNTVVFVSWSTLPACVFRLGNWGHSHWQYYWQGLTYSPHCLLFLFLIHLIDMNFLTCSLSWNCLFLHQCLQIALQDTSAWVRNHFVFFGVCVLETLHCELTWQHALHEKCAVILTGLVLLDFSDSVLMLGLCESY